MSVSSHSMYWNAVVVQRWRLDDDTERADERDGREQPEHEPIKHHRHELPVLFYLRTTTFELNSSHLLFVGNFTQDQQAKTTGERNPARMQYHNSNLSP